MYDGLVHIAFYDGLVHLPDSIVAQPSGHFEAQPSGHVTPGPAGHMEPGLAGHMEPGLAGHVIVPTPQDHVLYVIEAGPVGLFANGIA